MKTCTVCNIEKTLKEFYKSSRLKDGYQSRCKVCADESCKETKQKDKGKYKQIQIRARTKFRRQMRTWKEYYGCSECGETFGPCLELHHPNSDKERNPSDSGSFKQFLKEAEKCIILCANCHRKLHWEMEIELE